MNMPFGERGGLSPEFHADESGKIRNEKGDEFDEELNLVKEALSQALLLAREKYGRQGNNVLSDNELNRLGYVRACKQYLAEQSLHARKGRAVGK